MSQQPTIEEYRAQGRFIETPLGRLFAIVQGTGEAVIFLHGIPTYSYLWRDVLPIVALEHRAIAPDLLGFGLSEKRGDGDYSVQAQADAIESLLRQLGIERAAIVCHDFGALVAAELISRRSEICAQLVILNTSLRREGWSGGMSPLALLRVPLLGELALAMSRRWMLRLAMGMYVNRRGRLTPEIMRHYWWPFEHGFKQTLLRMSRERAVGDGDFQHWRETLSRLAVPCLIIWGDDDPTFTRHEARDLNALVPSARLEVFQHANHFVPEDRPLAAARLIIAFLGGRL